MKSILEKVIVILSLLLSAYGVSGQGQANAMENGWGIQAGWKQLLMADRHVSPLLYRSDALVIGGTYRTGNAPQWEVSLNFQVGTNQAQTLGQRTGILDGPPDIYGEKESFEVKANPFLSLLGGQLRGGLSWPIGDRHRIGTQISLAYMQTGMGLDTWHYTQLDLAPTYSYYYPLGPGQFNLDFSLPVLAMVQRPNYAFDPSLPDEDNYYQAYLKEGTKLASLDQLINPQLQLGYTLPLRNGRRIGVQYQLSWMSYPDPRPVRMLGQGLTLTLTR
ncbi:MAG: hypothetical protein KTR30_32975 [Saprospiraceae bacterium]|nr:hypothetical protein [Saprospiraceae bacterium]